MAFFNFCKNRGKAVYFYRSRREWTGKDGEAWYNKIYCKKTVCMLSPGPEKRNTCLYIGIRTNYSFRGPIGIFDSGYGGLTILRDCIARLPDYDYIYIGDNARNPYGPRSFEVVYRYTLEAVERLFEMECPLVVIACNTASAKALRSIQQNNLPGLDPGRRVLGVIRPSAEAVGKSTKSNHVGILATQGTVASDSYVLEINKLYPEIAVTQEACPMWVPLAEYNEFESDGADYFVKKNIESLMGKDPLIDCVMLGCTHYPLLVGKIRKYLPAGIALIEQGPIVADSLADYLARHPEMNERLTKNRSVRYFSSESSGTFEKHGSQFMSKSIRALHIELSTGTREQL